MRDINLGTCATIVGTTTACTPLPPSNVEICLCHTASSGHLCFSTLLGGRGALGSGERGTWERIGSFFKSSKDLLHYSMLFFRNVPSIFDLHCRLFTALYFLVFFRSMNFCVEKSRGCGQSLFIHAFHIFKSL